MRLAVTFAFALLIAGPAAAQDRGDQWVYGDSGGSEGRVAAFLSYDYRHVLFHASCEKGALVLAYVGETPDMTSPAEADGPLVLELGDDDSYSLATTRQDGVRTGRLKVTPAMAKEINAAADINIAAGLDMGDPWYTGAALPLKRIVRDCAGV